LGEVTRSTELLRTRYLSTTEATKTQRKQLRANWKTYWI